MQTHHPIDDITLNRIDEILRISKVHAKHLLETHPESARLAISESTLLLAKIKTARLQFATNCISREQLAEIFKDIPISPPEFSDELKKKYCKMLRNLSDDDMATFALLTWHHTRGGLQNYGQCIRTLFRKYVKTTEEL